MTTCSFLESCAVPEAAFASVDALARHIDGLRVGKPIVLSRCVITTPDHNRGRQGLAVRLAETGEGLGYAIVGELASGVQYDLLGGALARLCREAA